MHTQFAPRSSWVASRSGSTQTRRLSFTSSSISSSNHWLAACRSRPLRYNAPRVLESDRLLFGRTVLEVLRPPALLLLLPAALRLSAREPLPAFDRTLGATMTSASGAIFANGDAVGGAGVREVTMILAVDVGERCKASGCICSVCASLYVGFGRARICDRRLSSRNVAWSSMTMAQVVSYCIETPFNGHILSQSSGVNGSILIVCATGGSRCMNNPTCKVLEPHVDHDAWRGTGFTFCPSVRPRSRPNVVSSSTVEISCSLERPLPIPSLPMTGASFRLLGMPVHPKKHDRCGGATPAFPVDLYCSSMITF